MIPAGSLGLKVSFDYFCRKSLVDPCIGITCERTQSTRIAFEMNVNSRAAPTSFVTFPVGSSPTVRLSSFPKGRVEVLTPSQGTGVAAGGVWGTVCANWW